MAKENSFPPSPPQLRSARESDLLHIRRFEEACGELRGEVEARRHEVEQLSTLSLRGDATVQEYMANLKVGLWGGEAGSF